MSNVNNSQSALTKFFQWMTQQSKTAQDVANEADSCGRSDGVVTKNEFTKYIKGTTLDVTNDEISQIYKTFDTNTKGKVSGTKLNNRNALTDEELGKMQEKLEAYQQISALLDGIFNAGGNGVVAIPATLKNYVSRSSVEESLWSRIDNNYNIPANVEELLTAAIAKSGADGYGKHYFQTMLSTYRSQIPSDYTIMDDQLEGLLGGYIATLNGDTDLNTIIPDVENIVTTYFASAGFGSATIDPEDSENPLRGFVWNDNSGLNGLQLAVLKDMIISSLATKSAQFANYQTQFNVAVQGYVNDNCSGGTFNDIKASIQGRDVGTDFMNSKYGKALMVLINYGDFSAPTQTSTNNVQVIGLGFGAIQRPNAGTIFGTVISGTGESGNTSTSTNSQYSFYNALKEKFGEDFARALAEADVNYISEGGVYSDILNTVANMIMNGELDGNNAQAVQDKIIELIGANYSALAVGLGLGSSSGNGDIEALYKSLEELGNNAALAAVRTAAIAFLDAAAALNNDTLNNIIKREFGEDYAAGVNQLMSQSVIKTKCKAVNDKLADLRASGEISEPIDPSELDATWNDVTIPPLKTGGKTSAPVNVTATFNKEIPATSLVTYDIDSYGGATGTTASITEGGALTITSGDSAGNFFVKVKVMVDGVTVGTKTITTTIEEPTFSSSIAKNALGGAASMKLSIEEDAGWSESRNQAVSYFTSNVSASLKAAAVEMGYSESKAENAANTLTAYFTAAINALDNMLNRDLSDTWLSGWFGSSNSDRYNGLAGGGFTYHDYTTGQDVSCSDKSSLIINRDRAYLDEYSDHSGRQAGTGIYIGCDTTSNDSYYIHISSDRMIALFQSFLGA